MKRSCKILTNRSIIIIGRSMAVLSPEASGSKHDRLKPININT